jgi:hypothetical protein
MSPAGPPPMTTTFLGGETGLCAEAGMGRLLTQTVHTKRLTMLTGMLQTTLGRTIGASCVIGFTLYLSLFFLKVESEVLAHANERTA